MSKELTLQAMRTEGLLPDQARFILDLLAEGSPQHHQLCAPVGTGKRHVAAFLIGRFAETASNSRVLVLGPAPVSEQLLHRLRERSPNVQATFVNRKRYRELEASVAVGESPWKDTRIVVMSDGFAKQKDIATSLATVKWDWVVVDESHRLVGERRAMVENLLSSDKIARLLLLSATPVTYESLSPLATVITTDWPDSPKDWDDKPLKAERKVQVVKYQRTPDEVAVMTRLNALLEMLVDTKVATLQKAYLYYAAQSSLSSLEQVVSTRRNRLTHGQTAHGLSSDLEPGEDEIAVSADSSAESVWQDSGTASKSMVELLDAFDDLRADSKLDALTGLIDTLDRDGSRGPVCIVSAFQTTVAYLLAALKDGVSHLYGMTSSDDLEERRQSVECCMRARGVLVTSIAAMRGFELSEFRAVALYDLPHNPRAVEQVLGTFESYRRETPCVFYTFQDISDVLKVKGVVNWEPASLEQLGRSGDVEL